MAKSYFAKAAKKMKKWADKKRRPMEYQEGDLVLVKLLPKAFKSVHKGLVRRYEGPLPITKRVGKVSYQLLLPSKLRIHPVFHVSLLKPYHAYLFQSKPRRIQESSHIHHYLSRQKSINHSFLAHRV